MKCLTKCLILFICGLLFVVNASAQQEMTLYFSPNVIQASQLNPAFIVKESAIAVPSFAFNYGNSAFTYNEIFKVEGDHRELDLNNVLPNMGKNNVITTDFYFDYFSVNLNFKKVAFNVRMSHKLNFDFNYSKDLIDLAWNGNVKFIGEEIQVAPKINLTAYREISVGAAYQIGQFRLGQTIKFLSGVAHASSANEEAILYTDEEYYQTEVQTNYEIYSAGIEDFKAKQISPVTGFKNPGVALDLGASYSPNDDWIFSASVIDLGAINWKSNTLNYYTSGSATFDGLDLNQYFETDTFDFKNYSDSIENKFVTSDDQKSFTQYLIPKFYISVTRKLTEKQEVGFLMYGRQFKTFQPAFTAYYGLQVHEKIKLGSTLSFKNKSINNLGLSYTHLLGKTQIFIASDNAIGNFMMRNSKNLNIRFGVNIFLTKVPAG